ncbi:hypothetical protein FRX94_12720, partial [Corynebacterium canis]
MITGSLKNQVDRVWDTFWSGGISNPMDVIEQFTYLLFIRQLDERQNEIDQKKLLGITVHEEENIFTDDQDDLRWKNLMQIGDPEQLHTVMATQVFPFLRTIGTGMFRTRFLKCFGGDREAPEWASCSGDVGSGAWWCVWLGQSHVG